jgi:N-acetylglucosaminyldiphosphoundecaprenol N-acetyl-beta-D-mannosaminyltransferase
MSTDLTPELERRDSAKVQVAGIWFDALTSTEIVGHVRGSWATAGGSIIPINVDVARAAAREPHLAELIADGTLVVADGMPIVWASRVSGTALPERIAGSSLVFALSEAAARDAKSVFVLGGAPGVPDKAADALTRRYPGLRVVGAESPPFGFDQTEHGVQEAVSAIVAAKPDLVFVGLGFPRQERLIEKLRAAFPRAWYVACGGGIPMAAGVVRRANPVVQRLGLEWLHRLALEPRRLAGRYLRDDLPFAFALLTKAALNRVARREPGLR